jgi:nitroreductase
MRRVETDARPFSAATLPVWAGPAERLRFLLGYAVLAPSRHNVQPWAFEIEGDEVRLFGDFRRALHVVDPRDRELIMSCGAALLNLRVAAAHFGYATSVEVVAGSRRDGMLARVRLEERRSTTPQIEELFRAIPHRRTNRLPLDSREPPPGLVAELAREAALEGGMLRPVGESVRRAVAELVAEGDRLQWRNPRFRAELSAWTRSNATRRLDGMPGFARGMSDAASWVQPVLVRLADAGHVEADRDRRRTLATKALLVLETHGDTPADWLLAGEALQRVLLRATASGLYASYFNSAIEEPELRVRLREALGEMGSPQLMFRLGYGLEVRPTPRRPVDAVLRGLREAPATPQPLATRPRT